MALVDERYGIALGHGCRGDAGVCAYGIILGYAILRVADTVVKPPAARRYYDSVAHEAQGVALMLVVGCAAHDVHP